MILVLVCIASAMLVVWLLVKYRGGLFGDFTATPRSGDRFGIGNASAIRSGQPILGGPAAGRRPHLPENPAAAASQIAALAPTVVAPAQAVRRLPVAPPPPSVAPPPPVVSAPPVVAAPPPVALAPPTVVSGPPATSAPPPVALAPPTVVSGPPATSAPPTVVSAPPVASAKVPVPEAPPAWAALLPREPEPSALPPTMVTPPPTASQAWPTAAPASDPTPTPTAPGARLGDARRRPRRESDTDRDDARFGAEGRNGRLRSRLRRREPPPADLAANGARVDSVDSWGEVRVISRTRRQRAPMDVPVPPTDAGREGAAAPPVPVSIPEYRRDSAPESGVAGRDVTVITGARWRDPRVVEPREIVREPTMESAFDSYGPTGGATGVEDGLPWLPAGARRAASIMGSRAREAILGYPFPPPDPVRDRMAPAPGGGAEPAPGETVVLEGDDVEAWVRERLYGGRLPER